MYNFKRFNCFTIGINAFFRSLLMPLLNLLLAMYMFIIFERNYHRKLLKKTGCNYLLPFWNCDIFFTAIKIRFFLNLSKNGRNSIVNISKTKSRRYIFLCIFGKSMPKLTTSRMFMKKSIGNPYCMVFP